MLSAPLQHSRYQRHLSGVAAVCARNICVRKAEIDRLPETFEAFGRLFELNPFGFARKYWGLTKTEYVSSLLQWYGLTKLN